MPYRPGSRLPAERASRLGHLEVISSDLVKRLCENFEEPEQSIDLPEQNWKPLPCNGEPLGSVFGVDGSLQVIESPRFPYKALAFVKTALLSLDQYALAKLDKESPHPLALKSILEKSVTYHATAFPLRGVRLQDMNTYDAVRNVIFDSLKDDLDGEILATLKWIAYEKWDGAQESLQDFECPHCEKTVATLPNDAEDGNCPRCNGKLLLTDMLGFHLDMTPEAAPNTIANTYMSIHETLLLFTGIRYFWETDRRTLSNCLFVKDGPLSIRAQYSKLVAPIRRFLSLARDQGSPVHIIGQEKSGIFADHLELIGERARPSTLFVPNNNYIVEQIQHRPNRGAPYGRDTNYGAKVFIKINAYHQMVLNIPTGNLIPDPEVSDLIGLDRILATLPDILSNRYEGALLPIELAHGVASLSTYPSAKILQVFSETQSRLGPNYSEIRRQI